MKVSVPAFEVIRIKVFLKSTSRALAVLEHALVEHLIEKLHDVGMSFFHFVEQHNGVRLAADRLGEHAAFAVADVSRRRTLESRNRVGLS